jgi:predicted RNA-binding protein with TRAM domain
MQVFGQHPLTPPLSAGINRRRRALPSKGKEGHGCAQAEGFVTIAVAGEKEEDVC